MPDVLILGATGNICGLTAGLLAKRGYCTLRLASSREKGREKLARRFLSAECVIADWYDPQSLAAAMQGAERVLVVTPDFHTDEAVVTPNIIAAAKTSGSIKQIVRLIAIPPGLTADQLAPEFLATRCGANLHVVAKPLLDASGLPATYINVPGWIMFNLEMFFAHGVKASRRLVMPQVTDAPRMWISEVDIAEVAAKILTDPPAEHVGREHVLTGSERFDYRDIARLLSAELGEKIEYVDDDRPLRAAMGDFYDVLMTYFRHETQAYAGVTHSESVAALLGKPQVTIQEYIKENRAQFL